MIAALLHGYRRRAALSVALAAATVGAGIGLLATSGYLISKAALEPPILTLTVAIVGVRFFAIGRAVLRYLERLVSHDLAFRVLASLRVRVYERLVPLAPAGLERFRSADLLSRFVADVDSLQHVFLRALAPPLVALVTGALAVAIASAILPAAGLALAGALVLAATSLALIGLHAGRGAGRRQAPARAELTAELDDLLRGAPELVVYGVAEAQAERVRAADRRLTRLARHDGLSAGLANGLGVLLAVLTAAVVLAVAIPAVADGRVSGVHLAVLAFVALAAFEAVTPLPAAAQHLAAAASVRERLEEITAALPPVANPARPRTVPDSPSLALERVRFRYAEDVPWILDGIDLRLEPGRRVALVGASGSGKTTLARLLVRFCDPVEGRATLGGHDLREYDDADVRRAVLLASEDAHLFATSIRENVRLGNPAASEAEIVAALRRAGAWPWVASLPDGLETLVGENGALVSGGQRQRIALARALVAGAPLLILDEPTAHLDEEAAAAFVDELRDAADGAGLLLITHRLVGLDRFDEIAVLEDGRIVERGTERELLARGGRYAALREQR